MVAFAGLDIREVIHQLDISRPGVASVAAIVALLHLLAGSACVIVARRSGDPPRVARSSAMASP